MFEKNKVSDQVTSQARYNRVSDSPVKVTGRVHYDLYDEHWNLKKSGDAHNIVTTQGDRYFVNKLSAATQATISLMVLGTGTANVAKADTWVAGYYAGNGSAATGDGTCAPITNSGTPANLEYVGTFAAGYGSANSISRVLLTNMNPSADGNGTPTGTSTYAIAHGTINPSVNKGANDTLVVTWDITFLGA